MAKKYLLYIHNEEQFDKVDNKSQLINDLLDAYWSPRKKSEEPIRSPKKIILENYKGSKVCKKGHFFTGTKCMQKGCQ
jgi:hypothetical protein